MGTTLRTPADLLEMARKFRDGAGATSMPEYTRLMTRTAEDLEEIARHLERGANRWEMADRDAGSRASANR